MTPEHIVMFNDTLRARGGATGLAVAAIRGLRARGHAITAVIGDDTDDPELRALGVDIINVGSGRVGKGAGLTTLASAAYNQATIKTVQKACAAFDHPRAVYHVHSWSKSLSASLFRALRDLRGVTLVHGHDFFLACPNGAFFDYRRQLPCTRRALSADCATTQCDKQSMMHKAYRLARHGLLRRALGAAPDLHIIAIHEEMRRYFMREGFADSAMTALPNPSEPLCAPIDAGAARSFLFLGRVVPEKGPDLLCAAARRAQVKLILIGEGELLAPLRAAYPEFTFAGWCDKAQIATLARDARALVMPSRYPEPYGLAAAEALGAGLPVVLSRTAFLAADIARHGCGRVIDPFDEDMFAQTLGALAADDDEIARMSAAALCAHRLISPTMDEWLTGIEHIYDTVLSRHVASAGEGHVSQRRA